MKFYIKDKKIIWIVGSGRYEPNWTDCFEKLFRFVKTKFKKIGEKFIGDELEKFSNEELIERIKQLKKEQRRRFIKNKLEALKLTKELEEKMMKLAMSPEHQERLKFWEACDVVVMEKIKKEGL